MKQQPAVASHLIALLMPFTMIVVVPALLVWNNPVLANNVLVLTLASALFTAALALFATTLGLFIKVGKGTLAPWDATKHLVVRGPYRFCRNPMISAVFGMMLADALAFLSLPILVWAILFFVVNTMYFMVKEEPDLEQKFGAEYRHYKQNVPRWLPRFTPYK